MCLIFLKSENIEGEKNEGKSQQRFSYGYEAPMLKHPNLLEIHTRAPSFQRVADLLCVYGQFFVSNIPNRDDSGQIISKNPFYGSIYRDTFHRH